ncbi:MAG: DNA recombination protein RmuC [Flavobacteriaceae bacterium]|nr:DNA recombination protein RmuC [Flavobacteriaceae bacterium]
MPNTFDFGYIALATIVLFIALLVIFWLILRSAFHSKTALILHRENELKNQFDSFKNLAEKEINTLKEIQEKLTFEKNSLEKEWVSQNSDLTNLRDRIEDFKIETTHLKTKFENVLNDRNQMAVLLTQAQTDYKNLQEKLLVERQQLDELNEKFKTEFENLANKILEEKSQKFSAQNQANLSIILDPLQEKIKGFEKRVEDTHKENIERGAQLRQQIIGLKELNEQMSKVTENLTRALKGESKTQGNWGEMILESVLEKSGLQKNSEYFIQQGFDNEDGRKVYPDVIIHLPENKKMIIDAKVSLNAYERYVNETEESMKNQHLNSHLLSIKKHITTLSEKNYQRIYEMNSPDFVMLFIPIESAFAAASYRSPGLFRDAFERNIILVTPTTLLAVLKTIDSLWQNEKQKKNSLEIALQAGKLYDTFVLLIKEMHTIGNQLDKTQKAYATAMKKLTGERNLIKNIENLKILGAKTSKNLDENMTKSVDFYHGE